MDDRKFRDRSGIKVMQLANGVTVWLREDTKQNMNKILEYLKEDAEETGKKRKCTFAQLSKATGIIPSSVSHACYLLALRKKPFLKMWAEKTPAKTPSNENTVFTRMRVKLI